MDKSIILRLDEMREIIKSFIDISDTDSKFISTEYTNILELQSHFSGGSVQAMVSLPSLKIEFVSSTVTSIWGQNPNDWNASGFNSFLNTLSNQSYKNLCRFTISSLEILQTLNVEALPTCNLRVLLPVPHNKQDTYSLFVQAAPVSFFPNGKPSAILIMASEISYLMRSGCKFFGRLQVDNQRVFSFQEDDGTLKASDFFSEREREVVSLLAKGFSSKQIGEVLYISPNTVDNHRKNLLRRAHVKDTTALLQLCKLFGVI